MEKLKRKMSDFHVPVLLKESVDQLITNVDGVYVDVTFGGGGHSQEILNRLSAKGSLIVFDQDGETVGNRIEDKRITYIDSNFRYLYRYWKWLGVGLVDGVLADLGVSSHQFDTDYRGFSFRFDAELDMRMNESSDRTAADILSEYSEERLQSIFSRYGEIRNSKKLARVIVEEGRTSPIISTTQLNKILDDLKVGERNKYFAQVYQALRIEVNEEMDCLQELLEGILRVVKVEGRIVAISYHSLEDRMVKRFLKSGSIDGVIPKDDYGRSLSKIKMLGKIILPTEEEQEINARSRSAKMRVGLMI